MHSISIVNRYWKHDTTKRGSHSSFCYDYLCITFSTSYCIGRRNLFMEHWSNDDFHFSEQCEHIYSNSNRS